MEFFNVDALESGFTETLTKVHDKYGKKYKTKCKCPDDGTSSSGDSNKPYIDESMEDDETIQHSSKATMDSVKINNIKFNSCQKNKTKTDHCISDIYTFDDFGLPVSHNTTPASDKNLLYTTDGTYKPDPDKDRLIDPTCENTQFGCCADNRTHATDNTGSNCVGFEQSSGLVGSPVRKLKNTSLGGTKRTFLDKSSGNSYMPYIKSHLPPSNVNENFSSTHDITRRQHNICSITKYVMLVCIILIIILIICVYTGRQKKTYRK